MDITTFSAAYKMVKANCAGLENEITELGNDINNLNLPKLVVTIPKSSSKTLVFTAGSGNLLVVIGAGSNQASLFTANTGSSALTIGDVMKGAGVTYTKDGLELTISNGNASNSLYVGCINIWGNYPTEKVVNND